MERSAPSTATRKKAQRGTLRSFLSFEPAKVKPQEVILLCRQLSSFVRVGIPVTTALMTFADQATSPRLKATYTAVVADLERGARLSDSFARHPRVFPAIVIDMVRSAEVTGNLDVVLRQAARHIEREANAKQRMKSAMTYPIIIASMAIVIAVGMVLLVLPKFRDLYASLNVKLPGLLTGVLGFSDFVGAHALVLTAVVLVALVALGYGLRTPAGRLRVDALLLRLPLIAPMIRAATTERFCRTLGDMLGAGVPISQTFAVVLSSVNNRVYRRALERVGPAMAAGKGIYRPLADTRVFAPSVVQMIRVGEETGHMQSNLTEAADMHEEELDFRIKRLTAIIEPLMIVFVGLLVGFVAVTMVSSIYSLAGSYK
jgi:type IV pilus assembly protein PilC